MRKVVCLAGDGIGPEVVASMKRVLAALDAGIEWVDMPAGESAIETHGEPLPQIALDAILEHGIAIKGPTTTPLGGGFKSVNVRLRQAGFHTGVRPIRSLPIRGLSEGIDFAFVREGTEGLYRNTEVMSGPPGRRRVEFAAEFTEEAATQMSRVACEWAVIHGYEDVTFVNKENIIKESGRMYREAFLEEIARHPGLRPGHLLVDVANMMVSLNPWKFRVIATSNLFGDILSDGGAALLGGNGIAPGANFGDERGDFEALSPDDPRYVEKLAARFRTRIALFESVHGSAPDIAGQGKANPTALLLSAAMLLDHLGLTRQAERLRTSIDNVYREGRVITGDLAWRYKIDPSGTDAFTDAVIANL